MINKRKGDLYMSRRRDDRRCRNTKASFDALLCVEFDVVFDVDAAIDEGSITVEAVEIENDENGDFGDFR